ncbi:N-acetylglucosamine-6-phosphate deacetylase [Enorma burkinafasonensis]|uniref:N-acetylglucosamine-6-phosphate deacetylase n=1 Tax=Enorma burkinafasonensis TaxID=2590867 RepID=UPI0026EC15BF|nr:N-acetylglucosamine-6-phosphate deacetylase [Enorma burkinafasonensis]MCI7730389.1 N-acetylglucosamine-6-phosphate deacetylase [Enorma burkinafasonensis]
MASFAISADRFVLPGAVMQGGYLMVEDGVFGTWTAEKPDCEIVSYPGATVGPGLVDTHIHGFNNHATTDCDPASIDDSSVALAQAGTTTWLPTTFTESPEDIERACAAIAAADEARGEDFCGARIGGIFLEGPFFTTAHVGAQNPAFLIAPDTEVFNRWQEAAGGRIVKSALAAEKEGACPYIAALDAKGVVTAIGHSDATYDEALAAVNAGATCFVHTYNGQRGLHHRDPGCVGCAMTTPETYAEIIVDGKHVAPAAIKALVDAKGWQHCVPITDCLICGGMPEGEYVSGGLPVVMKDGLCRLKNEDGTTGSIAGSVLTLARGVKNLVDWQVATAEQAIRMATEVAARSAKIDGSCGSIKPGRAADLTIFNADMTLAATYVGGRLVA